MQPGLVTAEELARLVRAPAPDANGDMARVCAAADEVIRDWLTAGADHTLHVRCREAALHVAGQIWQARVSPGGQMIGGDLGLVTPQLLGPGLLARVAGMVGSCSGTGIA